MVDRGNGMIIERYPKFVKPAFDEFICSTKKYMNEIVQIGEENTWLLIEEMKEEDGVTF